VPGLRFSWLSIKNYKENVKANLKAFEHIEKWKLPVKAKEMPKSDRAEDKTGN